MGKILLLEDEIFLGETIQDLLTSNGYKVDYATDGNEVLDLTFENSYDLYIFDINVPEIDGLDLLKNLRDGEDTTPAIFISAMTDLKTILKGFEAGADDYIKKPFFPEELLAKVNLKLARKESQIRYRNLEYFPQEKKILKNGKILSLGEVQFKLFDLFIQNVGRIIDKEEIYECMENPSSAALRVAINKLKNTTGLEVENVRGIGYTVEKS